MNKKLICLFLVISSMYAVALCTYVRKYHCTGGCGGSWSRSTKVDHCDNNALIQKK